MDQEVDAIGIIGVGHLAGALVAGLMATDQPPAIVLSPHNLEKAETLARRFGLEIAQSNAEVVECSDLIIVATRPPDVLRAISGLPWRTSHTLISVAAGVQLSVLERSVRPATVVRALPITAAEIGESPTCLIPDNTPARSVFGRLGTVHTFDDEATFDLASTYGVVYSVFHALIGSTVHWFESSGLPEPEARRLCILSIRAATNMIAVRPEVSLDAMVDEFAQPGGLTLAALQELRSNGVLEQLPDAWRVALNRSRQTSTGG